MTSTFAADRWSLPATGGECAEAEGWDLLSARNVVLLGERHDRAEDHLWQARVIDALARRRPVSVGLEMVPRHADPVLADWASGELRFADFLTRLRWAEVWGHDPEIYRPLLTLCRDLGLPMLGLNVDRPLVRRVRHEGWDTLPAETRGWLSPAPPASAAYRAYLFVMTGGARPDRAAKSPADPAFDGFVRAQQVWDRAFACAIARARAAAPERLVIGIIGRGHLEYGYGVPTQLADLGLDRIAVALPDAAGVVAGEGPIADLVRVTTRPEPAGS
jgi:uncharacterized iron-regulated protein